MRPLHDPCRFDSLSKLKRLSKASIACMAGLLSVPLQSVFGGDGGIAPFIPQMSSPLRFDSLQRYIQNYRIRSVESLIPRLPSAYLRNTGYDLIPRSQSRQGSSSSNPRVVAFGDDGRFILTFNGDPSQIGGNSVEIMEFEDGRTQLHEIRFPTRDQDPVEFDRNPRSCLECHGESGAPIWGNYFLWPGVFGAEDSLIADGSTEYRELVQFMARAQSHPRYRHLVPPSLSAFIEDRYGVPSRTYSSDGGQRPHKALTQLLQAQNMQRLYSDLRQSPRFSALRPLLRGLLLNCFDESSSPHVAEPKLRVVRFFRDPMQAMRRYEAMARLVLILNTQATLRTIKFIGLQLRRGGRQGRIQRLLTYFDDTDPSTTGAPPSGTNPLVGEELVTDTILSIIINEAGLDPTRYTLNPGISLNFNDGNDLWKPLLLDLDAHEGQLHDLSNLNSTDTLTFINSMRPNRLKNLSCEELARTSRAALDRAAPTGIHFSVPINAIPRTSSEVFSSLGRLPSSPPSLRRCITCHDGASPRGPRIPFAFPQILKEELNRNPGLRTAIAERLSTQDPTKKMPPSAELSTEEQTAIQQWVNNLR